jgi:beta-barrel assembly-enhancing protease
MIHAPQFGQTVRDPKTARSLSVLVGCFAVMIAAVAAVLWLAWSSIEHAAAAMIPVSVEESLGRAAAAQLSMTAETCSDPLLNQTVNSIVSRLSAAIAGNPYTFRVSVIDDPAVNAFAAPGGYIVVFRGLAKTASSPDELAGVLAHEMQHVTQRHSLKGMIRSAGIFALISLVAGDVSAVAAAAGHLGNLRFQRADEEQADREGMKTIQRARLAPEAMVRIYERLALESGDLPGALQYLSTHPEMKDRVGKLKRLARESRYHPVTIGNAARWTEIRESCR